MNRIQEVYPRVNRFSATVPSAVASLFVITETDIIMCSSMCLALFMILVIFLVALKHGRYSHVRDVKNYYDFEILCSNDKQLYLQRKMKIVKKMLKISRKMNIKTKKAMKLFRGARRLLAKKDYKLCWIVLEDIESMLSAKSKFSGFKNGMISW